MFCQTIDLSFFESKIPGRLLFLEIDQHRCFNIDDKLIVIFVNTCLTFFFSLYELVSIFLLRLCFG